jgi:uncharacterized membrane protein YgcG
VTPLGKLGSWRHLVVGGPLGATTLAAGLGIIGEDHAERFDSKQVVVSPAGTQGLHVREVVDQDFGNHPRRGYQRLIPNDFGVPIEVTAESATAPDDVRVEQIDGRTRIRVGDPDRTIAGQHRYVLEYTYPNTTIDDGTLALDVIGTDETLETRRFEVVVTGLELEDPLCNVGGPGASGGCELARDGDVYRAVIAPLDPGEGVTIGGTVVGRLPIVDVAPPPEPEPQPNRRAALAAANAVLGTATAAGVFVWARRRGRNEVFAGGAADAAFGVPLPPPVPAEPAAAGAVTMPSVRLVPDDRMDELATTEFVPPTGVDPWLGNVLLTERFSNDAIGAWFAGHAADEVLAVSDDDSVVQLRRGPRFASAPPEDRATLEALFANGPTVTLGKYSPTFAKAWRAVGERQRGAVDAAGYWKRPLHGASSAGFGSAVSFAIFVVIFLGVFVAQGALRAVSLLDSPAAAVAIGILAPLVAAFAVYRKLLPARTATGSALALRTESFRRFLAASEARHVEWAWSKGLLREYSAWAVALGTAETWEAAMNASTVPPSELHSMAPLLLYHHNAALTSTRVAPSSSGSSGSSIGGFSGGSVGGGGGGGSSGSW